MSSEPITASSSSRDQQHALHCYENRCHSLASHWLTSKATAYAWPYLESQPMDLSRKVKFDKGRRIQKSASHGLTMVQLFRFSADFVQKLDHSSHKMSLLTSNKHHNYIQIKVYQSVVDMLKMTFTSKSENAIIRPCDIVGCHGFQICLTSDSLRYVSTHLCSKCGGTGSSHCSLRRVTS